MDTSDKRADALNFLKANKGGVLSTVSPDGLPHAWFVYYAGDDEFGVSFITLGNTRKAEDLAQDKRAAFVIATENPPQTLQIEGYVTDVTEKATIDDALVKLAESWFQNAYGAPLTHMDPATVRYYRLVPTYVRWGDFTSGSETKDVITEIPV